MNKIERDQHRRDMKHPRTRITRVEVEGSDDPYCVFCKKNHPGGDTCLGHHP